MTGIEILNLIVGVLAIILSVCSLIFSYLWKQQANHSLEKIEDKSSEIKDSIDQRIDSLLDRVTPRSQQEHVQQQMGFEMFKTILQEGDMQTDELLKQIQQLSQHTQED